MTEYSIEVQPDFLERQAHAQPVAAVAQLIWNGLDADATTIRVDFQDDQLGGMAKIIVTDDGHGFEGFLEVIARRVKRESAGATWSREEMSSFFAKKLDGLQAGHGPTC